MENLFGNLFETEKRQTKPLADRMRPERLSDFVGQESAVGAGSPLRRMIERDVLQSVLFYGPPGTGKTTLAKVIAHVTGEKFEAINAVSSGVPELRKLIAKAQEDRRNGRGRTIVFIDEIHRFNKAQQDVLLPYVENGTVILVGATTENPSFELNSALLSRCKVFVMNPLNAEALAEIVRRAGDKAEAANAPEIGFTFHHALALASGNPYYPMVMQSFRPVYVFFYKTACAHSYTQRQFAEQLASILDAVRRQDPQAAEEIILRIIDNWVREFEKTEKFRRS